MSASSTHVSPGSSARPGQLLALAIGFGLFSGLAEVFYWVAVRLLGVSWYLRLSPDFLWMTPVTDVLIFLVPGLLFSALAWAKPPLPWLRVALFVYTALALSKLLLLSGKIHELAVLVLACGAGAQATRLLTPRFERVWPWATRTLTLMVCLTIGLAATRAGVTALAQQQALARLPAPPQGAPNVLLICLDTVRAKNLSLYGYHRLTSPQLERWAKKGVTFDAALAPAPWTLPSLASTFTGRYPDDLSTGWHTPLDATHPTLAEVLTQQGYSTGGFVANRYYAGIDSGLARGFAHYDDYDPTPGEFINSSTLTKRLFGARGVRRLLDFQDLYGRKNASEVSASFLDWQARVQRSEPGRPFFAFLNYFDAHDPYLPPEPFDQLFGPPLTREQRELMMDWWPCYRLKLTAPQIDLAMRAYDSCLAALDHEIGRLLDELDRRGVLANTLVIITSDHGEHFGEHDLMLHGNSLSRVLLRVPLVVIQPGRVPAGQRVKSFVSLRELPATVLDLAGLSAPKTFPGRSLARYWTTEAGGTAETPVLCVVFTWGTSSDEDRCSPVARGSLASIFMEGKYYIRNLGDGSEELYDFANDPQEQNNLVRSAEGQALLPRYREALRRAMAED
ncbi:MAG: sulfatase-like hydrolase/transferase [Gemmataceae bacterium]|nr:sulfatase-like hydrolase/transferase [Gemmataceae bacterium]